MGGSASSLGTLMEMDYENGSVITFKGTLDVHGAACLRDVLLAAFAERTHVRVDLAETEGWNTAGIQALCSAALTARSEKKSFTISGISSALQQVLATAGVNLQDLESPGD